VEGSPEQSLAAGARFARAPFTALPEVEWRVFKFKTPLLKLNDIFPEGIPDPGDVPRARNIVHLADGEDHGHAITTGSIKTPSAGC